MIVSAFFPNKCIEYNSGSRLNWFLFGKRIYDSVDNVYFIIFDEGFQFIDCKTGDVYKAKSELKIAEGEKIKSNVLKKYDGYGFIIDKPVRCNLLSICENIVLNINNKSLILEENIEKCRFSQECISNNSKFREMYSEFPTCQEIIDNKKGYKKKILELVMKH